MSIFYPKKITTGYYAWGVFKQGQSKPVKENLSQGNAHRESTKLTKEYFPDDVPELAETGEWWKILKPYTITDEWRLLDNKTTTNFTPNKTVDLCNGKNKWDTILEKIIEAIKIDLKGK
jgi:hypothetical protein